MSKPEQPQAVSITLPQGQTEGYAVARMEIEPTARHALVSHNASRSLFGGKETTVSDCMDVLRDITGAAAGGDLSVASQMLTAQASTLDALFTQMAQRSLTNMGVHPDAMERYMRLALKAQAQSRATLETLVKMHQPREQTVRHIHVGPDGQAVFIENLHGGLGNARISDQAHAQSSPGAPLLGHDADGNGVPVPGGTGQEAVPHARRGRRKRGADRQP